MQMKSDSDKAVSSWPHSVSRELHVEAANLLALGRKLGVGGCLYFWIVFVKTTAEDGKL
jgi:hypothetical protein